MDAVGSIQTTNLNITGIGGEATIRGGSGLGTPNVTGTVSRSDAYSSTSLSMISQNTRPQSPAEFGTLALAALLLGQDDDDSKNDPLRALIGLALLSQLQQQSQQTQYVQFDSQSLQSSQSLTLTSSATSPSTAVNGASGAVGGQLDVTG